MILSGRKTGIYVEVNKMNLTTASVGFQLASKKNAGIENAKPTDYR